MNYSEMSDYEISCEVARAISFSDYLLARNEQKNYCNSWADAGPIILANKITISAPMQYDQPADWLAYPSTDSDICVSHPSPLRAAMTVFLIMQEATRERIS